MNYMPCEQNENLKSCMKTQTDLPIAADNAIEKVYNPPSEQNPLFPFSLSDPKHFFNIGEIIFLQYEYTPKYNPTLGMDPKAETPNPAYKLSTPPGRLVTRRAASTSPRDVPPSTCCWTVLSVSKGAKIVLEQAAAIPDASVFLSPSIMAVLDADSNSDFDVDEYEDDFGLVEGNAIEDLHAPPRMSSSRARSKNLEEGVDGVDTLFMRNGRFASVNGENIKRRFNMALHLPSKGVVEKTMVIPPALNVIACGGDYSLCSRSKLLQDVEKCNQRAKG
ncbi:hypothetical protein ACHAXS_007523 [Conticribra weissflogii]